MASMVNKVIIGGNLTRDPELRTTPSGTAVANTRIAHNDRVKRDGEWVDTPYFFDVTIWGNLGEAFVQHFHKGKAVLIEGRLTWREWEKDGVKNQRVEIVCDRWFFMGAKGDGGGSTETRYGDADYSHGGTSNAVPSATAADDDIPFAFLDMYDPMGYGLLRGCPMRMTKLHV